MARSVMTDLLSTYSFWLMDAYPVEALAIPILTPLFGFSSITSPEISLETMDITEGNWFFKKKVIKGGEVSNITMERGVAFYDSDFWRWTLAALSGDLTGSDLNFSSLVKLKVGGITPRRTLLLVQFFPRSPARLPEGSEAILQAGLAVGGAALAGGSTGEILAAGAVTGVFAGVSSALQHFGLGPFEFTARLPAKAWLLHGAIPVRYKAGGDFDASSSNLSIQQIEIAVEMVEEISLLA